jgi:HipA-like protein
MYTLDPMATMLGEVFKRLMGRKRSEKSASFRLVYAPPQGPRVTVGHLTFEKGWWTFEYAPEYRIRSDLRPIEGFDDLQRVYRSKSLFPFFAVRVPDEHRTDVQRRLAQDDIEDPDTSDLLRMFGRKAAASPSFELIER